jgi:CP12 domain
MVLLKLNLVIYIKSKMSNIQEKIQEELQHAREVCGASGSSSSDCAVAWDTVEELQAEASHQKQEKGKNSLEVFCDDNPDAAECRIYED